jgi:hypothetical protein
MASATACTLVDVRTARGQVPSASSPPTSASSPSAAISPGRYALAWLPEPVGARQSLFSFLEKAVGRVSVPRLQTTEVMPWYFSRYYTTSGNRVSYLALVAQDMTVAWRLLRSNDLREKKIGLRVAQLSCLGVGQQLQEYDLQVQIYESLLLPHLELATAQGASSSSRWGILEGAAHAYRRAGIKESEIAAWRSLLAGAPSVREADSARINLALALSETRQSTEAAALLRQITTADLAGAKGRIEELLALGAQASGPEGSNPIGGLPADGNGQGANEGPLSPASREAARPVSAVGGAGPGSGAAIQLGLQGIRAVPGTPFAEMPLRVTSERINPIPESARGRSRVASNAGESSRGEFTRLAQADPAADRAASEAMSPEQQSAARIRRELIEAVEKKARRGSAFPTVADGQWWEWYFPRYSRDGLRPEELYSLIAEDLRLAQRWLFPPPGSYSGSPEQAALKQADSLRLLRYSNLWAAKRLKDSELEIGIYEGWLLPGADAPRTQKQEAVPEPLDALRAALTEGAAEAYERSGEPIKAIRLLREFVKSSPSLASPRMRTLLADLLVGQAHDKDAVSLLKDIELPPVSVAANTPAPLTMGTSPTGTPPAGASSTEAPATAVTLQQPAPQPQP